jgi:adenylosuccinate synthase
MRDTLAEMPNGGMVVVCTDGGAGSSGKGSLNAWLADTYDFHVATNNFATNAGHFVQFDDGIRILNQHICSAFINKNTIIYINPGASIDLKTLFNEIKTIEGIGFNIKNRLFIHPNANVITEEDKQKEKEIIKSGSTFKGCGAALARKTLRIPGMKLAKDYEELHPFIKDMTVELNTGLQRGMRILVEGSQGMDLDINFAEFPHCTSRQTHPSQLIADAGLPPNSVTNVIVNLRPHPIRINNQSAANPDEQCYSGNYWGANEITWQEIAARGGYTWDEFLKKYEFALYTSVTKKVRRVFEFPVERMKTIHAMAGGLLPNSNLLYSLNFANFIDKDLAGTRSYSDIMKSERLNNWLHKNLYPVIGFNTLKWIRTGPHHSEIVEL